MAKTFVSPGVFTNEVDVSFLGPGVGAIGAAIIGSAPQGPAFVPTTVRNFNEFVGFFGDLNQKHDLGYAARAYLRNAGTANVVRVLGPAGRTVNGSAVTPGYTADSVWAITAGSGSVGAVMALFEVTASADIFVTDLTNDQFFLEISGSGAGGVDPQVAVTASFISASSNFISKVVNTDPTRFATVGYYLRETYGYAVKNFAAGNAKFNSASYAITSFAQGYNSGSTTWIKSQGFAGVVYDLFRVHTIGHGEFENGRFKVSVSNIRPSSAPGVTSFGKFDLEVRAFDDKDNLKAVVESFPNLSLNESDTNFIGRAIGDKFYQYDATQNKMYERGNFANRSKYIRIEMASIQFPDASAPWGFGGFAKPVLAIASGTGASDTGLNASIASGLPSLPYVADLKDKDLQAEADLKYYWGVEFVLSGNVTDRLDWLPSATGADADFSLRYVSGSTLSTLRYDTSIAAASQKSPGSSLAHSTLDATAAKFTLPVAYGFDGFDRRLVNPLDNVGQLATVSQLGTQALRQAVDIISDPDFIDINMLCIPGIFSSKVADYAITKMQDRGDAFYVADITGSTVSAVVNEVQARSFDTNYASVYYPGIKVWDDINRKAKVLPASVAAIGVIAYNDRVAYPWFAPAGLNRAGLSKDTIGFDVLNIEDQLNAGDRDTLYENRINPIARFPDVPQGVIWGQKTLQLKSSALDRINVRRLMIRAKKLIASAVKFLVFEPNNAATQTRFKQLVNPILADIQQKQGLERFLVVMDETTNTPELIDRNIMAGKIFLVPTRTAEFISVDFIISPTGATFGE
jgi:hypothetical protein